MKGGVRKRKNGKWEYYFDAGKVLDENGNPKRKRITKYGFETEEEALKAKKEALEEFENKGRVFKDTNISMAEYLKFYMDNYVRKKCKPRTIENYESCIRKHINPHLGHYYIRNIDSRLIQNFLDIKYKEGYAKQTMEIFLLIIRQSLSMAIHPYEFIREDNFSKAKLNYKFAYKKQRTLTKEQLYKILDFLKENDYEYYVLFMIAWHTGMRRSEILGLTWDNVDLENKVIYVIQQQQVLEGNIVQLSEPKSNSSVRDVAIGDTLVELLKEHKKFTKVKANNNNFVNINTKGNWMLKHNVSDLTKKIKNKLGIHIGMHDIRHLHGTLLCQENANLKGLQQRLGHSNVQTTLNIYVRTTDEIKKNTANIFEESVL